MQTGAAPKTGKIRGIVFDSLLMAPLKDATVTLMSRMETVTSDEHGAFSFDNVAVGLQTIAFESTELDSLGLGTMGATISVADNETARVTLSTASLRTMWQRRCNTPLSADSGIVWGTIRDANSNKLLRDAIAAFNWFDMRSGPEKGLYLRDIRQEVLTDSTGMFFACGVPTDVVITTAAIDTSTVRGKGASGFLEYAVGARRLQRLDLVVSPDMIAPVTASNATREDSATTARARGRATLKGVVLDDKKKPVADATVSVTSADTSVVTNTNGQFTVGGLPAGTHAIQTKRIGFAPVNQMVALRTDSVTEVQVISSSVNVIGAYNVRSEATRGSDRAAFDLRRKMGFGTFMEAKDLARRMTVGSALRQAAGLRVEQDGSQLVVTANALFGKRCVPGVFVDGMLSNFEVVAMMRPVDFRAIEVYARAGTAPMQYASFTQGQCGVILFWTKGARW